MKPFKLDQKKIETGFKVPEQYFDQFEEKIMRRLADSTDDRETAVIPLWKKRTFWYAAAAVLVVCLGSYLATQRYTTSSDPETLEHYLAYHTSINQFDLLTVLDTSDIRALAQDLPVEDSAIEDFITNNPDFDPIISD